MEITGGLLIEPQRLVVYGPEGIGKSTIVSRTPNPVFIDVEGSTADLDVQRSPIPGSWTALIDTVNEFAVDHHGHKTLVVDTADCAERLCIDHVCASNNLTSLGGQDDFGKSYGILDTEWRRLLDMLTRVAKSGMHVCLTAHAKQRKLELPDQDGSFDRWELKMEKRTSAATKEWARTVLFLNYKTYIVEGEKKLDKAKGKGGHRVIYTTHHPAWDAKNRVGLPDEVKLEYSAIESLFAALPSQPTATPRQEPEAQTEPSPALPVVDTKVEQHYTGPDKSFLDPLRELLTRDNITEHELQLAVAKRGYYPADTPLANYEPKFVAGKLVAHWAAVLQIINEIKQEATQV
jgi:hypothetical protein